MSLEYKSMEGQRIGAALGAIGALPAAALVLGKEVGPAAPFFALALVGIVAAYLFWLYTDGVYHLSSAPLNEQETLVLKRLGYHFQHACFAYGAMSLLLTLFGVAAVHSGIHTPIPIWAGFAVVLILAIAVLTHCGIAQLLRNRLFGVAQGAVRRARDEDIAG